MSKERYNQIIGEVYDNYKTEMLYHPEENWLDNEVGGKSYRQLSKDEFIDKCKTDPEFSEKWGLKIEERELNLIERTEWWFEYNKPTRQEKEDVGDSHSGYQEKCFDKVGVPTKLITLTYNNETIESYE